jgi:hypothetical protein
MVILRDRGGDILDGWRGLGGEDVFYRFAAVGTVVRPVGGRSVAMRMCPRISDSGTSRYTAVPVASSVWQSPNRPSRWATAVGPVNEARKKATTRNGKRAGRMAVLLAAIPNAPGL